MPENDNDGNRWPGGKGATLGQQTEWDEEGWALGSISTGMGRRRNRPSRIGEKPGAPGVLREGRVSGSNGGHHGEASDGQWG